VCFGSELEAGDSLNLSIADAAGAVRRTSTLVA
jgi:hypothetical protein